jgi:hypothetical protein
MKRLVAVLALAVVAACGGAEHAAKPQSGWTAAEEAEFLHGTGQPGSKLHAHARCLLRATEKVFPTAAEWHAWTDRLDGDNPSRADLGKADRIGRGCKLP